MIYERRLSCASGTSSAQSPPSLIAGGVAVACTIGQSASHSEDPARAPQVLMFGSPWIQHTKDQCESQVTPRALLELENYASIQRSVDLVGCSDHSGAPLWFSPGGPTLDPDLGQLKEIRRKPHTRHSGKSLAPAESTPVCCVAPSRRTRGGPSPRRCLHLTSPHLTRAVAAQRLPGPSVGH
jgi:hypothetical protein